MLLPGETFEGYLIDRELGRGGVGIVYKATQLSLNRVVALKLLAPELNTDPEVQARFRNEGITQAAIAHPNVVAVYESGEHDGQLFLAMKYIEGHDLKRLIQSGKLESEEAIRILAPVAAALDAAHRLGYVHRDVKSRNILIDADGRAYLADFGLTKGVADRTLGGGIAGTPGYLAPEQIEGRPATPASDVYALAAVLHECLTGRPPSPDAPPAVPDAIGAVLALGLAKQPKRRPASAGELIQQAAAALAGDTIETGHTPRKPRPSLGPIVAVAGGVALVTAIVLALVLLIGGDDPTPSGEPSLAPGGGPVTVAIRQPGQPATLTFRGRAGQRLSAFASDVDFGGQSASVVIRDPAGQALKDDTVSTDDGTLGSSMDLPATGTYTVIVEPENAATGSLKFSLPLDVRKTAKVDGPPTALKLSQPGQHATVQFEGRAGQRVAPYASKVKLFDQSLSFAILGPDGSELRSSTLTGGDGDIGETLTLPRDGRYTVILQPDSGVTGSLTLGLPLDVSRQLILDAPATRIDIKQPGQNAHLQFEGRKGQRMSAFATDVSLGDDGASVSIADPDGDEIRSGIVSADNGEVGDGSSTLRATGTYTVNVDPEDGATGSLSLALPLDVRQRLTVGDAATTIDLSPGQNALLSFEGRTGQRLTVFASDVELGDDSAWVTVYDADDDKLLSGTVSKDSGEVGNSIALPATGTYWVTIEPMEGASGSLGIALPPDALGSARIGGPVETVRLEQPGQHARVTFAGRRGQRVSLIASAVDVGDQWTSMVVRDSRGESVASSSFSSGGEIERVELPRTGTYTANFDPEGGSTGSFRLRLR